MEPGQDTSGQTQGGQNPGGWHRDPMGRFEYRYFNGVQWTSDVAINGQRYVDAPITQFAQQAPTKLPSRGMAIASFITGVAAVALGWVPFVFVFAAVAAITAFVFGILGLQNAKANDGRGRGFALTGVVLAPIALVVCVGGFFFTRAVVREFRDFIEPGRMSCSSSSRARSRMAERRSTARFGISTTANTTTASSSISTTTTTSRETPRWPCACRSRADRTVVIVGSIQWRLRRVHGHRRVRSAPASPDRRPRLESSVTIHHDAVSDLVATLFLHVHL